MEMMLCSAAFCMAETAESVLRSLSVCAVHSICTLCGHAKVELSQQCMHLLHNRLCVSLKVCHKFRCQLTMQTSWHLNAFSAMASQQRFSLTSVILLLKSRSFKQISFHCQLPCPGLSAPYSLKETLMHIAGAAAGLTCHWLIALGVCVEA